MWAEIQNSGKVLKQNETFQKQETDEIKPQGLNMEQTKKNGSEQEKQTGKFSFFGIHPKGSTEAEKKAEVPENPEEDADAAVDALFGSKPKKKSLFGKKKEKPEKVVQKEEKKRSNCCRSKNRYSRWYRCRYLRV